MNSREVMSEKEFEYMVKQKLLQKELTPQQAYEFKRKQYPNLDPRNVSGKKLVEVGRLAELGREVLSGKSYLIDEAVTMFSPEDFGGIRGMSPTAKDTGDYTDVGGLNMRVDEVCHKGGL